MEWAEFTAVLEHHAFVAEETFPLVETLQIICTLDAVRVLCQVLVFAHPTEGDRGWCVTIGGATDHRLPFHTMTIINTMTRTKASIARHSTTSASRITMSNLPAVTGACCLGVQAARALDR